MIMEEVLLVTAVILRVTTRTACFSFPQHGSLHAVCLWCSQYENLASDGMNRSFFVMETMCFLLGRDCFNISWEIKLCNSVSVQALTPYPGDLNHCRICTPASEDGLKESPKHVSQTCLVTSLDTTRPSTIFYRLLNWASLRRHYERSLMMEMYCRNM
jgi:hypothetical protein